MILDQTMLSQELHTKVLKTGTSIVGIVCKDGIVLGGDRRVTAGGQLIVSKRTPKVMPINNYVVLAGAGVASDIDLNQRVLGAELKLKELKAKSRPTVKEAASLVGITVYRNVRSFSTIPSIVGMLVAGVNEDGSTELYTIEPAGTVSLVDDYDANFGSGMPFILGLLERQYKKNLSVNEGVELVKECLKAAIERDPGSGNGMDIFTITKDGIKRVISQETIPSYKDA